MRALFIGSHYLFNFYLFFWIKIDFCVEVSWQVS